MGKNNLIFGMDRIEYTINLADEPLAESPYRIADFEDGKWELYERDYHGTRWYKSGAVPQWCYDKIRDSLEPVARVLGIELTSNIVWSNSAKSLLDKHCQLVESRDIKFGEGRHPNIDGVLPKIRYVYTYRLNDDRLIHLLDEENWGQASINYPDKSSLT
jgi:hypothetical protein